MEWLKDLNQYSNLILVIVTIIYVYLTYKMLKSNKELIQETTRPYVVVDLSAIDNKILLNIKNEGNRAARNILIVINPNIKSIFNSKLSDNKLLKITIPFLAPNSESIDILHRIGGFSIDYGIDKNHIKIIQNHNLEEYENIYHVKIRYSDNLFSRKNKYYKEKYKLNIYDFLGEEMKYSLQYSILKSMEEFNKGK